MGNSLDRWGFALLIVAIGSALALCMPALRGQALALDEQVSFFSSGAPTLAELWLRCEQVAVLPPVSHFLERAALAAGGRSETVFRIPSLAAYVIAVFLSWWMGRIAGGTFCGGLTALLVAWHPGVLDEVRFARCYGLVLCLSALSTALLLQWRINPHRRRMLVLWGLTAAALLWTHYLAAPLLAAQAIILIATIWKLPRSRRSSVSWAGFAVIVGISLSCVPLGPAILRLSEWGRLIDFQRSPASKFQAVGAVWTLLALSTVIALQIVAVFFPREKKETPGPRGPLNPPMWVVLTLWLLPLALVGLMAVTSTPMLASPRYRVMIAPASALAVSLALTRAAAPLSSLIVTASLLSATTLLQGSTPFHAARLGNPVEQEWKRIGLQLAPHLADPSSIVFTQTGLAEGILLPLLPENERLKKYVACRLGPFYTASDQAVPIPLLWEGRDPLRRIYQSKLSSAGVREVWIAGASDTDLNAQSVETFAAFVLSEGFEQASVENRLGITLFRLQRPENRSVEAGHRK